MTQRIAEHRKPYSKRGARPKKWKDEYVLQVHSDRRWNDILTYRKKSDAEHDMGWLNVSAPDDLRRIITRREIRDEFIAWKATRKGAQP